MLRTFTLAICFSAVLIFVGVLHIKASVPAAPQASDTVVVKMTGVHKFMPDKLTVKVGQTVEWVNEEPGGLHEVTDDPDVAADPSNVSMPDGAKPFDSHIIRSGNSFKYQFTIPGVYKYVCPPHEDSGMMGQVTVTK